MTLKIHKPLLFTQDIAAAQGDRTLRRVLKTDGLFFNLKLNFCLKLCGFLFNRDPKLGMSFDGFGFFNGLTSGLESFDGFNVFFGCVAFHGL